MATIIRIKRRHNEEPAESLVVARKKLKTEEISDEAQAVNNDSFVKQTLLKRITTVAVEGEAFDPSHISKLVRHAVDLKEDYKKPPKHNIKDAARKQAKDRGNDQRYKIVSSLRSSSNEADDSSTSNSIHILDVEQHIEDVTKNIMKEDEITCNGVPMNVENVSFVYDLYVAQDSLHPNDWIQDICEIRAYNTSELVHDISDDDAISTSSDDEENEEGFDYPDEDEDHLLYEDEDDFLSKQMQKAKIYDTDESYDLDDYDEDFDEDGTLINAGLSTDVLRFKTRAALLRDNTDSDDSSDDDYPVLTY